jgi:hypothetical protein
MKYVAEITIRTGPFLARDADHARQIVLNLRTAVGIAYLGPDRAGQIVEIEVQEVTEMDG